MLKNRDFFYSKGGVVKKGLHVIRLLLQEHQKECQAYLDNLWQHGQFHYTPEDSQKYWDMWDNGCNMDVEGKTRAFLEELHWQNVE